MIPDPSAETPSRDGAGGPARDDPYAASSRAGTSCWLCGHTIINPPQIIGQMRATQVRVAHRYCLRVLGELDLDLPPVA